MNAALSVSISPTSATAGQLEDFNATVSGGTGPYTYFWYATGTVWGLSDPNNIYLISNQSNVGTFTVLQMIPQGPGVLYVVITDSTNESVTSGNVTITVSTPTPAPNSGTLSVTVSPTSATVGQFTAFTATVSGGTGPPYTCFWYATGSVVGSGVNPNAVLLIAQSGSGATSYSPFTPVGPGVLYVVVTDIANDSATSANVTITENRAVAIQISANSTAVSENPVQASTITATVRNRNGNPVQGIQVHFTATAGTLSSRSPTNSQGQTQVTLTPNSETTLPLTVTITASEGNVQSSTSVTFETPAFIFSVTTNPQFGTVSVGQTATTTITVSSTQTPSLSVGIVVSDPSQKLAWSLSRGAGQPPFTSTMTINTNGGPPAPVGTYVITITGVCGAITQKHNFHTNHN